MLNGTMKTTSYIFALFVGATAFALVLRGIIDTNDNDSESFTWWHGSTDVDSATQLMDLDENGNLTVTGIITAQEWALELPWPCCTDHGKGSGSGGPRAGKAQGPVSGHAPWVCDWEARHQTQTSRDKTAP